MRSSAASASLLNPHAGRTYALDDVSAPVYDADGAFVAGLALLGFDEPLDGKEVKRYAEEAVAAAARISAAGGRPAAPA